MPVIGDMLARYCIYNYIAGETPEGGQDVSTACD
jgi:hypothetical protein